MTSSDLSERPLFTFRCTRSCISTRFYLAFCMYLSRLSTALLPWPSLLWSRWGRSPSGKTIESCLIWHVVLEDRWLLQLYPNLHHARHSGPWPLRPARIRVSDTVSQQQYWAVRDYLSPVRPSSSYWTTQTKLTARCPETTPNVAQPYPAPTALHPSLLGARPVKPQRSRTLHH